MYPQLSEGLHHSCIIAALFYLIETGDTRGLRELSVRPRMILNIHFNRDHLPL